MPTDFEELKQQLLQSNDEFRQLATLHHDLDERIHNSGHPPLSLGTRTARRSHPQEEETPAEGSDGEHSAAAPRRPGRARARVATRRRRVVSGRTGWPVQRKPVRPLFLSASRAAHENRQGRIAVHRRRARAGRVAGRRAALRVGHRLRGARRLLRPTSSAIPSGRCRRSDGLVVVPGRRPRHDRRAGRRRWAPPGDWQQITIFLSPLDVHINRTPGRRTRHPDRVPPGHVPAGLSRGGGTERAERDLARSAAASRSSCGRSSACWRGASSAASTKGERWRAASASA